MPENLTEHMGSLARPRKASYVCRGVEGLGKEGLIRAYLTRSPVRIVTWKESIFTRFRNGERKPGRPEIYDPAWGVFS